MLKQNPARRTDTDQSAGYSDEKAFVDELTRLIKGTDALFSCSHATHEFRHSSGRADIVARSSTGELIAFEAKLTKWRDALHQAYRNSSFAHYSYVVLPMKAAHTAIRNRREFEIRGVGLCAVDDGPVTIEIAARRNEPLLPWITEAAISKLVNSGSPCNTAA